MALAKQVTTLTITLGGSAIRGDYILINGVNLDGTAKPRFSEKPYLVWWGSLEIVFHLYLELLQ